MLCRRISNFAFALVAATAIASPTHSPSTQSSPLIEQFNNLKLPQFNQSQYGDPVYVSEFRHQLQTVTARRAELAKQILDADPNSKDVGNYLNAVTANARFKVDDTVAYLDRLEKRTTSSDVKRECKYNRALLLSNHRDKTGEFTAAADAFISAADPKDPRASDLLQIEINRESDPAKKQALSDRLIARSPHPAFHEDAETAAYYKDHLGKPFELSFTDAIGGKKIDVKDLKGKVLVIDFWATWCGPCVGEMPENRRIYAEFHKKGVEFIGVSLDAPESEGGLKSLKDFCKHNQIPWPQYYQGQSWDSPFSTTWHISGIPSVFVVDADGNLANTHARGQLREILPKLLAQRDEKK